MRTGTATLKAELAETTQALRPRVPAPGQLHHSTAVASPHHIRRLDTALSCVLHDLSAAGLMQGTPTWKASPRPPNGQLGAPTGRGSPLGPWDSPGQGLVDKGCRGPGPPGTRCPTGCRVTLSAPTPLALLAPVSAVSLWPLGPVRQLEPVFPPGLHCWGPRGPLAQASGQSLQTQFEPTSQPASWF